MAQSLSNKARNIFIGLLNLPINIVRAVSGFIIGVDIFVFTCKVRFLKYLSRQERLPFQLWVLGFMALDWVLTLGISLIIPPSSFLWVIMCAEFEIRLLAELAYIFTSLKMASIQKGLQFVARKISQFIVNYPKLTIATMLFCGFCPGIVTSLFSTSLLVSSLIIDLGICVYLYEPEVSIFQLPMLYARKLSAVRTVEGYVDFFVKSCYYFLQNTTQNEATTLATYLKHINEDDAAYFFHNFVKREGKITLSSQGINDAQIAEFMQALADKPSVAKYIKGIYLQGNDISSMTIPSTLTALETLNVSGNKLKHIEFAEGLTNIERVLLDDNHLKEVNIPEVTLNTLRVLNVAGNRLTAATKYSLQQLPNRFPNLAISGVFSSDPYVINESMLQQHVAALVPDSVQPPGHLNVISKEARRDTFLVTTWMENQRKDKLVNYDNAVCNKIISYLYGYPITPQQAAARISKSLDTIKFSMTQNPNGSSDEITVLNDFITRSPVDGPATRELLEKEINTRFNAAITRDVIEVTNILQRPNSSQSKPRNIIAS